MHALRKTLLHSLENRPADAERVTPSAPTRTSSGWIDVFPHFCLFFVFTYSVLIPDFLQTLRIHDFFVVSSSFLRYFLLVTFHILPLASFSKRPCMFLTHLVSSIRM